MQRVEVWGRILCGVLLFGSVSCAEQRLAQGQFEAKHEGCDETTTIQDADGTVHVIGCGHAETYDCSKTLGVAPLQGRSAPAPGEYFIRSAPSVASHCKETGATEPVLDYAWEHVGPAKAAPPVEVKSEGGKTTLKLELVLNRSALLTLTAAPGEKSDAVAFRVAHRELDRGQDSCDLSFVVDDSPLPLPEVTAKREGEVLSQRLHLAGESLQGFDQIQRLSVELCSKRWSLNREQILRLRELMSRFRQEAAQASAAAP